jgi:N-acetylglucosaminyldiphosphoundecaprenol N-acetyl-beta-D-mannosaminyltransferase
VSSAPGEIVDRDDLAALTVQTASIPARTRRVEVLGCPLDAVNMDEAVAACERAIEDGRYLQHMSVNVAKLVSLDQDPALRDAVAACRLITADGQGVVWAAGLLGAPLPERVAGIDLMHRMLALAAERGYRPFILGAREEVLEQAVARLRQRHPDLDLAGWENGYFDDAAIPAVCERIRSSGADMLFVAMSSPRKELFLDEYGAYLGIPFAMGVGGAIDVVAGHTRRAPTLLQRLGLEWLYRLAQEPRRLAPRYFSTNARFARLLARALVRRAFAASSSG